MMENNTLYIYTITICLCSIIYVIIKALDPLFYNLTYCQVFTLRLNKYCIYNTIYMYKVTTFSIKFQMKNR